MKGTCPNKVPPEKRDEFLAKIREHVERFGRFLHGEGLCPVCGAEIMIGFVIAHMREVSDLTSNDFVHICMESISDVYDIPVVEVAESEVKKNPDGTVTFNVMSPDVKGRPN